MLILVRYGSGVDKKILHVYGRGWGEMMMWWFGVKRVVVAVDQRFWLWVGMVVVKSRAR